MNKFTHIFYSFKIYCLMLFASGNFAFSQSAITGVITDSTNAPIPFANVILNSKENATIVAFASSNDKGRYLLKTEKTGEFELDFIALSYQKKSIPITIEAMKNKTVDVTLTNDPLSLNEVLLQYEAPIRKRPDTTIFRASAFTRGNEKVIEDLLKNIPGLNVDDDGTIRVGNREVEKVMVDGDDFFERGYKILTKNMNAEAIETVEVYERYSNNRLLKGIEESERVAINLTLKEGRKREWFGNMDLGYGLVSENRYSVRTNLMSFGSKTKFYFLGNLNNIGKDATGDLNHLIRPLRPDLPGSIGDTENANTFIRLSATTPRLKKSRYHFNNTELASINTIFTLNDKMKLKLLSFLNWDENDFFRNSIRQFQLDNQVFTNTEEATMRKKYFTGFGKIDYTFDISNTQMLEYTGKFNNTNENTRSNLQFNDDSSIETLKQRNSLFDHQITYTNRIKDNEAFILTGRHKEEKTPQHYSNSQFLFNDLFPQANNPYEVLQQSENKMQFTGAEINYMNRNENGNLLEIKTGFRHRKDYLTSLFSIENTSIDDEDLVNYKNNLTYSVNDIYAEAKYLYRLQKIDLIPSISIHQFFNSLKINEDNLQEQSFFAIPSLTMQWQINNKNKVTSRYTYSTQNADIQNIYPGFVLTNFRTFSSGTGIINQLNSSSIMLSHQLGEWSDKFNLNTSINYIKNHDYFSTNSIVSSEYFVDERILFKNQEILSLNTTANQYLKFMSNNLRINLGYNQTNYQNIVNENLREITSENYQIGTELRSGFLGAFNYHIGTRWSFNTINANNISFTNRENRTFTDIILSLHKNFNVEINNEFYFFDNTMNTDGAYHFSDFTARLTTKAQKVNFTLSGKNLFNTQTYRDIYIDDINSSITSYRLLPRFLLLSVDFRF